MAPNDLPEVLRKGAKAAEAFKEVSEALDTLTPISEWNGSSPEYLRDTFWDLSDLTRNLCLSLLGSISNGPRVKDQVFLDSLAVGIAQLLGLYGSAVTETLGYTNSGVLEQVYGKEPDSDSDREDYLYQHNQLHAAICEAAPLYQRINSHIEHIQSKERLFERRREQGKREIEREELLEMQSTIEEQRSTIRRLQNRLGEF